MGQCACSTLSLRSVYFAPGRQCAWQYVPSCLAHVPSCLALKQLPLWSRPHLVLFFIAKVMPAFALLWTFSTWTSTQRTSVPQGKNTINPTYRNSERSKETRPLLY